MNDPNKLQSVVAQGQGIAFSMGNIDDVLKEALKSFADFKTNLPTGASFSQTWYQELVDDQPRRMKMPRAR